jgi:hypothetical protein
METELQDFVYYSFCDDWGMFFLVEKAGSIGGFKVYNGVRKEIWLGYKTRKRIQQIVCKLL